MRSHEDELDPRPALTTSKLDNEGDLQKNLVSWSCTCIWPRSVEAEGEALVEAGGAICRSECLLGTNQVGQRSMTMCVSCHNAGVLH